MDSVLNSFNYNLDFLIEAIEDLDDSDMVLQPSGIRNHPAWVLGHITYSCQCMAKELGLKEWLPEGWAALYGAESSPVGEISKYMGKSELLRHLDRSRNTIHAVVEKLTSNELDQPLPDESCREILPTIRDAIVQVLVAHSSYHIGQLIQWRRLTGKPSIGRSFL